MSPVSATGKKRGQGCLIPLILVVLFVGPIIAAWVLYTHPALWRPGRTTNYGELITPPKPMAVDALRRLDGTALGRDFWRGRWTLLYLGGAVCANQCRDTLYALRQIQRAQGKDVNRVQILYVMTDRRHTEPLVTLLRHYPGVALASVSRGALDKFLAAFRGPEAADATRRVYLIDPQGNLMMRYRRDADPKGMLRDLRHLLKISNGFM